MQFYGKLTSNQSIGTETMQFLWEIDLPKHWKGNYAVFMGNYLLNKVLEGKLCSFYGKLPSNQRIGRETMQFLWEINLPKYWKGKLCSFYGKLPSK